MSMTRKHFNAIAAAIASAQPAAHDTHAGSYEHGRQVGTISACEIVARTLADLCAEENPLFDRAKFLAACGVSDDEPECMACLDEQVCDRCAEGE